jgi:hypothetical protein
MSQVYQIRLEGNVTQNICIDDHMTHRVELTDILTTGEMNEILKQELLKQGWKQQGDNVFVKEEDGEKVEWDVESGEVKAKMRKEQEVSIDVEVTGSSGNRSAAHENAERALKQKKADAALKIADQQQKELEKISAELQKNEKERTRKINGVLSRVYTEALQKKAASLGSITSVEESQLGDNHQVIIRVEA